MLKQHISGIVEYIDNAITSLKLEAEGMQLE